MYTLVQEPPAPTLHQSLIIALLTALKKSLHYKFSDISVPSGLTLSALSPVRLSANQVTLLHLVLMCAWVGVCVPEPAAIVFILSVPWRRLAECFQVVEKWSFDICKCCDTM